MVSCSYHLFRMIKLLHHFLKITRFLSVALLVYVIVADKAFVKRQSLVPTQDDILGNVRVTCTSTKRGIKIMFLSDTHNQT